MEGFINGICAISPQKTFKGEESLQDVIEYDEVRFVKCIEPPYNELIDSMSVRRMSRIIKMGTYSALKSLADAGVNDPDAIITSTGLGCIEDTEKFITSIYNNGEKLLNPTPFIQSTHNSIGSAIALILKCKNYNNTYGHRGFSFTNALIDALMLLNDEQTKNILVGGMDEITPMSFQITDRLGLWKKETINNLQLLDYRTKGSLAGEGAAFFVLSNLKTEKSIAKIIAVQSFYKPETFSETENKISFFIKKNVGHVDNIDLIILGLNGDLSSDEIYYQMNNTLFSKIPCTYFKHLSGEYDTSSSFALYLASTFIRNQYVPDVVRLDKKPLNKIRNVLIYNHLRRNNHNLLLLSSC